MHKLFSICLVLLIPVSLLFGAGYQIGEHGAKAMGMGGAFVAQASDPSAIYFNPAGLGFQGGLNILAGATLIAPKSDFTNSSNVKTNMESQMFYPPNLYVSYGLESGWTFGLGVFTPYGLGTKWKPDWEGRYLAVETELQTFYINPTVAYKVNEQLSVGAGVSYVYGSVMLTRKVNIGLPIPDWDMKLDGTGNNFNFNAGLLYKATEQLSAGISYRHKTVIEFDGDATFTNVPNVPLPSPPYPPGLMLPALFPNQTGKTELPMPAMIKAGLAYQINENILVEGDFEYVLWSAYDSLTVNFDQGIAGQTKSSDAKEYKNSFLVRLGGQYSLDKIAIRAGLVYDQSPVPDKSLEPLLPDADRIEAIIGFGYMINEKFRVDAAYQFIKASERTVSAPTNTFPGTYNSTAHLFGLNLGISL
jgi:long-chain fatty acid transport protein